MNIIRTFNSKAYPNLPYGVNLSIIDSTPGIIRTQIEIDDWCNDTLGEEGKLWVGVLVVEDGKNNMFYFKTEQHRNWFILKWS